MTASTTLHPRGIGRRTLARTAAAIAIAGGATLAITVADDRPSGIAPVPLTPAQSYVDWLVSATPEELTATFGRGPVMRPGVPVKSGTAVR